MTTNEQIASHYTAANVLDRIDEQLRKQGINPEHPTLEALAPFDNLHSRGPGATIDQIALAGFPAGARVLDVGGGLGGPARALASRADVQVTVLDLTPAFVEQGRILTERLGMSDRVSFELGDGTKMPFADGSFDGVWTQHSTMNIAGKEALYAEIHRVLIPGGRLAMHEVIEGNGEPVDFPLPWAVTPASSDLRNADAMRALIAAAGFRELFWEDESEKVGAFLMSAPAADLATPPGAAVLGQAFQERFENFGSNLAAGKIVVIRALFERV